MDELKLTVGVDADVSGQEDVVGLEKSVDALGDSAKQAGVSARAGAAGIGAMGASAQSAEKAVKAVAAESVKYDALLRPIVTKTDDSARVFAEVAAAGARASRGVKELAGSFDVLGIRLASQIDGEIQEVNAALLKLAASSRVTGPEFDRAFAAGQARIRALRDELAAVPGAVESVRTRANGLLTLFGKLGVGFSGVELAREFVRVNVALEAMERTFVAVKGSSAAAAEELAYVWETADRLALPVDKLGKAYGGLVAATKGTRVEGQATREVFEAVAQAMSALGRSADETQGALEAVQQMASKGVVSMEELRGQLGERLPGALNATAQGLGITTEQLIKLVESGKLSAEQLFPALASGLNELYGASGALGLQTETLTQKWNRFTNSSAAALKGLGDAGVVWAAKGALEALGAAITKTTVGFEVDGKRIGTFFAAIAAGELGLRGFSDNAKAAFAEIEAQGRDKLVKAALHNRRLEASLDDAGRAALNAARAHRETASAAGTQGDAAGRSAAAIVRLNVQYGELAEAGEKATRAAKARAEATQAESSATVDLARALGTEAEQLRANASASAANAEALRRLADERAADLTQTERHLSGLLAEIATRGAATESEQKQIEALRTLITQRRAESDAASGHARSAAIAAAAAQIEAAAHADNSGRVRELAAAYALAQAEVEKLTAAQEKDVALTPQLEDARQRAAAAGKLYRDALNDVTTAIRRAADAKQAQFDVDKASLRLAIEQQRTAVEVARARGDEAGALRGMLDLKRLEIRLAQLTAQAKRAEADAALASVEARRQELLASGELTSAKEHELKALEASARAKQVEAEIAAELAIRQQKLADASAAAGAGARKMGGQFRQTSEDLDAFGDSADRAKDKLRGLNEVGTGVRPTPGGASPGNPGGDGQPPGMGQKDPELSVEQLKAMNLTSREIEDYYGNRRLSQGEQAAGLVLRNVSVQLIDHEQLGRRMGFTGAAVKTFAALFGDLLAEEMAAMQEKLRGATISSQSYITEFSGSFDRARQRAADQVRQAQARDAQSAASASVHRVEIAFSDGKIAQVDTASPDAAKTLIATLKELARRAS